MKANTPLKKKTQDKGYVQTTTLSKDDSYLSTPKGLGDTVAQFTHFLGADRVAEKLAKAMGKDDCGCNRRRKALNEMFPYTKETESIPPPVILENPPLKEDEIEGNYEILRPLNTSLEGIGPITLNIGTTLIIDKQHPLYNDIPHYYKNQIIKKL